jgi:uncharacterized protein with GYD domain
MATYVGLIQFADQGIRNIKDTVKRGDAAMAEAEKLGMKVVEEFWTMGAYDAVVVFDAPDDETMSAFMLKIGSLGNVKSHTMRAFHRRWKRFWRRSNKTLWRLKRLLDRFFRAHDLCSAKLTSMEFPTVDLTTIESNLPMRGPRI